MVLPLSHYLLLFCIYSVLLVFCADDTLITSYISQRTFSSIETVFWLLLGPLLRNLPGEVVFP